MDSDDLLQALRLWLPDGRAVAGLGRDLEAALAAAYAEFEQIIPRAGLAGPDEALPLAAVAAGRSILQDALKEGAGGKQSTATLLADLAWPDLLLAAACVQKNNAANGYLVALVREQVFPALASKWGSDRAEEIADDLPQKLHLFDQRGLNRGRPRLLAYGGRSRLVTWLRALGHREAIDRWRRQSHEQCVEDLDAAPEQTEAADIPDQLSQNEDLALIRSVIPEVFAKLMRHLPTVSEQQHRFAYLRYVAGLDNIEIAERLGVAKSRVTELSQQVYRRFMNLLQELTPQFGENASDATPQNRRMLEEALRELFSEADVETPTGLTAPIADAGPQVGERQR